MKKKLQKITFSIFTSLVFTNGSVNAQCTVPSLGSASPTQLCAPGGTTNLNATSIGNSIAWYTVPVGGTSLGSVASGSNFNVNAVATSTYYAEAFSVVSNSTTLNFTGAVQTFSAPVTGNYTLQAWGAKGGNDGLTGANGGYATGVLALTAGQTISVYVGGLGLSYVGSSGGGWNGGGNAGPGGSSGGGGGASDVRFGGTALANRVIVAGGGGGAGNGINAGAGGGLLGINGEGTGGTQSAGGAGSGAGSLGQGGNHTGDGGGGGGGYYGGGSAYGDNGGGGGSSYIGGVLTGSTIAGNASMPNFTGGTMTGNSVDGKVIIRYPSVGCVSASRTAIVFTVNPLPTITVSSGSICNGSSYTMIPSGASTYSYSSGSAVVAPTSNTSYTVTGTSAAGCVGASGAVSLVTVNANPIITVSSGSICNGSSYTMIPGGASTYTFTGGSSVVSPLTNTSYTVTGTSAEGCVGSSGAVSSVTVNTNPVVTVTSGSICNGSSFTMIPGGASTYIYSSGSAVVAPTANTSYTVTGTSVAGCTNTAVSSVTVNVNPTVTVNSGAICSGASFTMVPAGASTYVYTGGSAVVSPTANTNYTVTGTSALGCTNTAVSNVTVNALPILTATSGSICSGNSFTIVPTGAITYTYSGGSSVVSPSVTTSYTVSGSNAAGCLSSIVKTITVSATPVIIAISGGICTGGSWTITPTGATTYTFSSGSAVVSPTATTSYTVSGSSATGCQSSAVLTVSVNPTLLFNPNSGSVCIGSTFTMTPSGALSYTYSSGTSAVTPTATSTYTIVGVNSVGCFGTQICTVTVNALPTVMATSDFTLICTGEVVTLNASGATSYTWNTGATTASVTVSPTLTTTYTVNASDINGCNGSSNVTVNVNDCVGLQNLSITTLNISLYPNPTTGNVALELNTLTNVLITNALGQVVLTETLPAGKQMIDIKNQNSGIYFVKLNQNGKQQIIKLIKD